MKIRISVFTPEITKVKEFKYILNDIKGQRDVLKELTEYVCSKNEAVVHFGAFNSDNNFVFGHSVYITNTKDAVLINKLLKTADLYTITSATLESLQEIIKENKEE